jgi:signal transduction histidine kinase
MQLRLSLTAKGLILVCIPLIFEAAFVLAFLNLQQQSARTAAAALKARETSNRINTVTSNLYKMWDIFDQGHNLGALAKAKHFFAIYRSTYWPILQETKTEYVQLDNLTTENPGLNRDVKHAMQSLNTVQSVLDGAFSDLKTGNISVLEHYSQTTDSLVIQYRDLVSENFALLSKHARLTAELSSAEHAAFGQTATALMLVLSVLNAIFCLLLALYIIKGITSRIAILRNNTIRVARNEPLNSPIGGDDEIATLDAVFHSMAKALEETARMKQEFVSMLTHDLRSPLTAIQGSLELIEARSEKNDGAGVRRLIGVAERNIQRMILLINDMLDVQKIRAGKMTITSEQVCIAEVFDAVNESFVAVTEEHNVHLVIKDTDLFVRADRQKTERVLVNLVANAIKFSPAGAGITLSAVEAGNEIKISVSDQGKGISPEDQKSVFERFRQVDSPDNVGGSGLGLTICKYIVEAHGGKIWLESTPGQGTTFLFTLPIV